MSIVSTPYTWSQDYKITIDGGFFVHKIYKVHALVPGLHQGMKVGRCCGLRKHVLESKCAPKFRTRLTYFINVANLQPIAD